MRCLIDECCDAGIVSLLRKDGHDVLYVLEANPGISDDEILMEAFSQNRILLTEDKDFGELVFRPQRPQPFNRLNKYEKLTVLPVSQF